GERARLDTEGGIATASIRSRDRSDGEDGFVDLGFAEREVAGRRADRLVSERASGLHEVAAEAIVDPVGKGLAHRVDAEVSGETRLIEGSLEEPPRLNSTDRPVSSASRLEDEAVGCAEPALLELIEPGRERRPGGGMQQHRATLAFALHVTPGDVHALDDA